LSENENVTVYNGREYQLLRDLKKIYYSVRMELMHSFPTELGISMITKQIKVSELLGFLTLSSSGIKTLQNNVSETGEEDANSVGSLRKR
jgi:hypothetical protein